MNLRSQVANRLYYFLFSFLIFGFAFGITGCSKDLTRTKAASLIDSSSKFSEIKSKIYFINDVGLEKGIIQGMWVITRSGFNTDVHLTSKGQEFFQSVQVSPFTQSSGLGVVKTPVNIQINVTGIAEAAQGMKESNFTWEYKDLPSVVKRFASKGGSGTGLFRLYDDGWRLENIKVEHSQDPAILTEKELADEQLEIKKINEEKERAANLLRESQKTTLSLAVYGDLRRWVLSMYLPAAERPHAYMEITDVSVVVRPIESWGSVLISPSTYYFSNIKDYRERNLDPANDNMQFGEPSYVIELELYSPQKVMSNFGERSAEKKMWLSFDSKDNVNSAYKVLKSAHENWIKKYKEVVAKGLH